MSSIRLLIDSDPLIYGCGFSVEHVYYDIYLEGEEQWGPVCTHEYKKEAVAWVDGREGYTMEKRREVQPRSFAIQALNTKLRSIIKALNSNNYILYLTGKGNFRDEVATILPYKGNRDPDHKPVHYDALRKYMIDKWKAVVVEGYEADDALSMAQYAALSVKEETCIVTIDKDLNMVPGWHFNPNKEGDKYWVTEDEGNKFFYTQLLEGDRVDNIQGIPGIGKVKATKILKGYSTKKEMYDRCLEAYKANDLGYKQLEENARLLYMSKDKPNDWSIPE